ncbi:hypothetical protein [Shewanella maritima]|uniref:hypothetical protein n=1 Tax=Shewanella maritima TaxID=2520507 RepID=UPI003734EB46
MHWMSHLLTGLIEKTVVHYFNAFSLFFMLLLVSNAGGASEFPSHTPSTPPVQTLLVRHIVPQQAPDLYHLANDKQQDFLHGRWVAVKHQQALLCAVQQLNDCISQLPFSLQQLASLQPDVIKNQLGMKTAMVLSINHENVAGIVVYSDHQHNAVQTATVANEVYKLELKQQLLLSIWHELGHLHNISMQGSLLSDTLTQYEHEWLADIYVYWLVAQSQVEMKLIWQQFHRRNLAVMDNRRNLQHWSSPYLLPLLNEQTFMLAKSTHEYSRFLQLVLADMPKWQQKDIDEMASLLKQTFDSGVTQHLPHYLFWRQAELSDILQPTLQIVMGEEYAKAWLSTQFVEVNLVF